MVFRFYTVIKDFSKEMNKNNISAHASSAAFFLFLSLIPIMLLVCAIVPYTKITENNLVTIVTDILPASLDPFAIRLIAEVYDKTPAVISITAIVVIWSAAKGLLAIMRALNAINRVDETRNYFILRFCMLLYELLCL